MAKELFIMFIYDTQRCQKEDDDPQDAVLYFHPTWVSDQQKLALCGQLMGATQFFLSAFSCPRVISLNSGKFVVQQFGQYILTVGTDRNIPDWILQHRADTLHSLLQFYHKDFDSISSKCAEDGSYFNEKLHQIFETYVPIIQYAGNIFGTIPTVKLPKSAGSVFLEALQILQCFQAKGVLGGTVLYQNKVVATQLSSDLTKRLISTDPYRIKWWRKGRASGAPALGLTYQGGALSPNQPRGPNLLRKPCPLRTPIYQGVPFDRVHQSPALAGLMPPLYSTAESVVTPFHLPVGVQLLYVYVPNSEYKKLSQESSSMKSALQSTPLQKTPQRKIHQGKTTAGKEQMAMKRDTSRIFTVPEEEGELDDVHSEKLESVMSQTSKNIPDLEAVSEIDLGIKTECIDIVSKTSEIDSSSKEEADSGIKVDEIDSGSKAEEIPGVEFDRNMEIKNKTPLDDININRVLHAKVLSICCEGESDVKKGESKSISKKQAAKKLKSNLRGNRFGIKQAVNGDREIHSSSLNDLYGSSRPTSKAIPIRCYSFGLPQITHEMCDEHAHSEQEKVPAEKYFYNTIADPLHPCFRNDGLPISRSLFHDYVADHYDLLKTERSVDTSPIENTSESFPSVSEAEGPNNGSISQSEPKIISKPNAVENSLVDSRKEETVSFKQEVYRRSLSLPLKTTTSDGGINVVNENETTVNSNKTSWDKFGALESPLAKPRQFSNLQLTPLMSKLSILAMEEKSSLSYSRETTPCDVRELYIPGRNGENKPSRRPSVCRSDTNETNHTKLNAVPETEKAVLYVCGQQNMALLLLLDEKLGQDPELIHFLWETSLSGLSQLETHLHHCLEHLPQGDGMEPYSYICLDPNWDMLQRGGSWGALELDVVSCLHYDFSRSSGLTEVVLRCDDSTVYGYQCGRTEVFYQQPVGSTPGLPTPADLMGTVPLKAKRRLERDHGIILL